MSQVLRVRGALLADPFYLFRRRWPTEVQEMPAPGEDPTVCSQPSST